MKDGAWLDKVVGRTLQMGGSISEKKKSMIQPRDSNKTKVTKVIRQREEVEAKSHWGSIT